GVVFLIPFMFFFIKGWVGRTLAPKLIVAFVLGGLQGVLGWYMVKSGLVDRPDVSQYRLTAHLGAALVIYGYMFWIALSLLHPRAEGGAPFLRRFAFGLTAFLFLTILSGGFVAGLDAGFGYNTFPLMDGDFIPPDLFSMDPVWINLFENRITVQFDHRLLAESFVMAVLVFWFISRRRNLTRRQQLAASWLVVAMTLQVALGISTLLLVIPVRLAATHQAGAVVLFTVALWQNHEFRLSPEI
ncbi:MAG: COX15/CtaA family protein, partial [Rhodospirillales bacterium]|nr:COX15/CtaA family protein [Rhodospirillales bacterium]